MFLVSSVHTDGETYTYKDSLVVINDFSLTSLTKLINFLGEDYQISDDQLCELLGYELNDYDGVKVYNSMGYESHLIIEPIFFIN